MHSSRAVRRLIIVLGVIAVVEAGSAVICRFLLPLIPGIRLVWNPDLEQAGRNWDALASLVDDEIGGFRTNGSKENFEFPNGPSCGSAFGDSFVGGADVDGKDGWVEQLSHLLGCRVTNYAVGNYGTDQAYLRFRRVHDESAVAILGINPNNIEDNIDQYDAFLGANLEPTALKGRFLLDSSGHLQWVSLPQLDRDAFIALNREPEKILPHSYFLPDTQNGPVRLRFPYTWTLARAALNPRLHDVLERRTAWSALYHADHPSGALQLMTAICEAFAELAKSRGQRPLIVMLPLAHSFREQASYGRFEYDPLVGALRDKGIEVFDLGPAMIDSLADRSPCAFFTHARPGTALLSSPVPCGGHYSVAGNTAIAKLMADELRRRRFFAD